MPDDREDKLKSKDEDRLGNLLSESFVRKEEPFERPSDEAIYAYLTNNANDEDKKRVIQALIQSPEFAKELLNLSLYLEELKDEEAITNYENKRSRSKKKHFAQMMETAHEFTKIPHKFLKPALAAVASLIIIVSAYLISPYFISRAAYVIAQDEVSLASHRVFSLSPANRRAGEGESPQIIEWTEGDLIIQLSMGTFLQTSRGNSLSEVEIRDSSEEEIWKGKVKGKDYSTSKPYLYLKLDQNIFIPNDYIVLLLDRNRSELARYRFKIINQLNGSSLPFSIEDSLAVLRTLARYGDALRLSKAYLAELELTDDVEKYVVGNAERYVKTLEKILTFSNSQKYQMVRADRINQQADSLYIAGEYEQAISLQREAIDSKKALFGEAHEEVAAGLYYLAESLLAYEVGTLEEIDSLYRASIALNNQAIGELHPLSSEIVTNYGYFMDYYTGDFAAAETAYRKALAIDQQLFGEISEDVATDLNNIGAFLGDLGKYDDSEILLEKALRIRKILYPADSPEVLETTNNLGKIKYDMNNFSTAESLFNIVIIAYDGKKEPDRVLVGSLNGLALIYVYYKDYEKAEQLFKKTIEEKIKLYGENDYRLAVNYFNLADAYHKQDKILESQESLEKALELEQSKLGPYHPKVALDLAYLGRNFLTQNKLVNAESLLVRSAAIYEHARSRVGVEDLTRALFSTTYSPYAWLAVTQLKMGKHEEAWESAEKDRGRVLLDLLAAQKFRELSEAEKQKEREMYSEIERIQSILKSLKEADEQKQRENLQEFKIKLAQAEAKRFEFQKRMREKYPIQDEQTATLESVQSYLEFGSAIVGWLDIDDHHYMYLVPKDGDVLWKDLGDSSIREDLKIFLACESDPSDKSGRGKSLGRKLFDSCLAPIRHELEEHDHLYIIPSGDMVGIPIEALMLDDNTYVFEKWSISYIPSSATLAWIKGRTPRSISNSLFAVGDPPFNERQAEDIKRGIHPDMDNANERNRKGDYENLKKGDAEALMRLDRLAWSGYEVQDIGDLFEDKKLFTGLQATEENVLNEVESNRISGYGYIHFATHAYANNVQAENSTIVLSQIDLPNPLEKSLKSERNIDGKLTVEEIVRDWKLNSNLVTLSACESGLGLRTAGEGYIGFAHAFLKVGANSVVVSLWSVNDIATQVLMSRFYQNMIVKKMSKAEALRAAKLWMISQEEFSHPSYWAGFVLMGDPN